MAHVHAPRVKESTTTTGTGTYSLDGAATNAQTFVAGVGDGNTCDYVVFDNSDWETGNGTVTDASPDTLSRDEITGSSNNGNAVDWGAGTKTIACFFDPSRIGGGGANDIPVGLQNVLNKAQIAKDGSEDFTGNQSFGGNELHNALTYDISGKIDTVGTTTSTVTLDVSTHAAQSFEPTADLSLSYTNWPASGYCEVPQIITGGGDHTLTFPGSWDGGSSPTLQTGTGVDIVVTHTDDGGTTVRHSHVWSSA